MWAREFAFCILRGYWDLYSRHGSSVGRRRQHTTPSLLANDMCRLLRLWLSPKRVLLTNELLIRKLRLYSSPVECGSGEATVVGRESWHGRGGGVHVRSICICRGVWLDLRGLDLGEGSLLVLNTVVSSLGEG
jgi:hypothetical protein